MPMPLLRLLSAHYLKRRGSVLALLVALAAALELAAGVGWAYVAGFSRVLAVLGDFRWAWLIVLSGALLVSFTGYYCAYQGIFRVEGPLAAAARR